MPSEPWGSRASAAHATAVFTAMSAAVASRSRPEPTAVKRAGDEVDRGERRDDQGERDAPGDHPLGCAGFELPGDDADDVERAEPTRRCEEQQSEAEREQEGSIPGRRLDRFRDRGHDREGESGILSEGLHGATGAVGQEPERCDQDQREGQSPHEESERDPSGQQPTRAPPISIVRIQQDVNPAAPLTLLSGS